MTDRQRAATRSTVKVALATTLLTGGALFAA